jgi:hypothetical protein
MVKVKYPVPLMQMFGLSPNIPIDDKTMFTKILSKCTKVYGTKYKIHKDIYNILNPNDSDEDMETDGADYIFIRTSDIRIYLKNISINHIKKDNYIEVNEIFSDKPIKYLEVLME